MADVKRALVASLEDLGQGYVSLRLVTPEPHGAAAGQYLILHTDLPNPDKPGQVLKRAYSFAGLPAPDRFELTVATPGPTSRWLAARQPGDTLGYSGPWGSRFLLAGEGEVAFFATGSGLSPVGALLDAALAAGRPARLWWQTAHAYQPERLARWRTAGVQIEVGPALSPSQHEADWFLAGDGAEIERVQALLAGLPSERVRVERFFTPRPA